MGQIINAEHRFARAHTLTDGDRRFVHAGAPVPCAAMSACAEPHRHIVMHDRYVWSPDGRMWHPDCALEMGRRGQL